MAKTLFAVCIFFCMTTILSAADQATTIYEGVVLNEDATWRGTVLVKGAVVIAPQATLRIDPGTVVRFAAQTSNLVVQGRIHVAGTTERPVVLTSDLAKPQRGSWSGIVLLATEKRNLFERCRIEYAETGIDLRFSNATLKGVTIVNAKTALLANDGVVQMIGGSVSDSDTGIEMSNSEFDSKDLQINACQRGSLFRKTSVVLSAPKIFNNLQSGLEADECRIKVSNGDFSGNTLGMRVKSGEGQITMSRFTKNRQVAMHLSGTRLKIQRCLFSDNIQDAVRTEDGRSLFLNNAFIANGGFNLYNAGHEAVSARQNWWGMADFPAIKQKIYDVADDKNSGSVQFSPWLNEKPPLMP